MALFGVVAGLALATAHVQVGQVKGPASSDTDVELLLVDVLYDHLRLETALPAYQDIKGHRYLPLRQLGTDLGFRLHIDPSKRIAAGFLGSPNDRIALNGFTGKCVHRGKDILFDPASCFDRESELYVEAGALTRVTGLHFEWHLNRLELEVSSDSPLAVRQQWIQRRILERQSLVQPSLGLPLVRAPYRLWTLPALNMQWYTDSTVESKVSQTTSKLQFDGQGDLFFMNARYRYISAAPGEPAATLVTLGLEDPRAGLLGPLKATQFSIGDLNLAQVPLFARARNGMGATVSNFQLPGNGADGASQLDGHYAPHSTAELYRGTDLLLTVQADEQGHYRFTGIPLESGPNDLRVVLISPDGDVREERRTLYGDASGPAAGRGQYRVTGARVGDSIFPHALTGISPDMSRTEYIGEYQWGLSNSSWLAATAADTLAGGSREGFLGLGLHSWSGSNLWHVQTMFSDNGGSALSAGISRKLGNATVSLEHTLASPRFAAALIPEIGSEASSFTRFRLDGSFGERRSTIGYGLSIDRITGSSPATLLRARLTGGDGKTSYANTVAVRLSNGPIDGTGLLQLRRQFGSSMGRLDVGYGFGIEKPLQSLQLSMDRRLSADYRLRFGLDYDATRLGGMETFGAVYRVFGPLELGLNLALDSRGVMKANLLLAVGMEGEQAGHSMAFARPGSDTGSIEVRVYLDRNFNGRYDAGDTLLPNVGFRIDGRTVVATSGRDGVGYVDHLASNQEVRLTLDEDSLDDPTWTVETAGVLVIPRTGHLVHLDLAVIEAAEIEGAAKGVDPNRYGLTAQLITYDGKISQTSVVDSDGSYVFSKVRPGDYTLRLVDAAGEACGERFVRVAPGAMMKACDVKIGAP